MHLLKSTFAIISILTTMILSQSNIKITFRVNTPPLDKNQQVCITGNSESLGDWNPNAVMLDRVSDKLFEKTISFPNGAPLEFKFTLGSWESEAIFVKGEIPSNFTHKVKGETALTYDVLEWGANSNHASKGQITGTVKYHRGVEGVNVRKRDIIVWLPPNYDIAKDARYPVLYMHDGQNIFDPKTCGFGVDWQIDEAADSLIRNGKIEPIIIVGIYNTPARGIEYIPGDTGESYMKFVVETVKPLIDKTYRTLPGRENTAVGGSSLGGLISFMMAWQYDNIFSKAICFSPAFKIRSIDYVKTAAKSTVKKDIKLYIYNGGLDLEAVLQPGIDDMLELLNSKGYKPITDYIWEHDPTATHNEAAWAKHIRSALLFLFGNNIMR